MKKNVTLQAINQQMSYLLMTHTVRLHYVHLKCYNFPKARLIIDFHKRSRHGHETLTITA